MAYQTYHCSAAFRCSVCLIAFLLTSLALSVLLLFMLCAPCPFTAQFLFCAIQLLHSPPSSHMNHLHQQQPQQTPTATTTLLFFVPCIYSFCASCACNIHHSSACSYHANILHLLSALSDHHHNSSASLAIFPRVQHHWMLC
jgi:cobalamin synthase